MVLCDCVLFCVSSVICQYSLRLVNVYCDRFVGYLCVVYHVSCDNVSEVLQLYVILYVATEVNVTKLVMCTVLIVIMSVRYCNSM